MVENLKFPLKSGKEKPEIDWMEKIQNIGKWGKNRELQRVKKIWILPLKQTEITKSSSMLHVLTEILSQSFYSNSDTGEKMHIVSLLN